MTRAKASDVIEVLAAGGGLTVSPGRYRALLIQVGIGEAFTIRTEDGHALAVAGLIPVHGMYGDLWMVSAPSLARHLLPALRLARATISALAVQWPDGVTTWVRDDNRQGQRLARIAGFERGHEVVRGHRMWRR